MKKREGKVQKSHEHYILPIGREAVCKQIFTKFCTLEDILDIIICAIFDVEKLKGLGYMRGQILASPIEWLVTLATLLCYLYSL